MGKICTIVATWSGEKVGEKTINTQMSLKEQRSVYTMSLKSAWETARNRPRKIAVRLITSTCKHSLNPPITMTVIDCLFQIDNVTPPSVQQSLCCVFEQNLPP